MCVTSSYHALKRVLCVCSLVQQFTVLQLLTQSLQCVERLVELNRHGYFRQVLPDVVLQDVPQADVAGIGTGGGKTRPPLFLRTTVLYTSWKRKMQSRSLISRNVIGSFSSGMLKLLVSAFSEHTKSLKCRP